MNTKRAECVNIPSSFMSQRLIIIVSIKSHKLSDPLHLRPLKTFKVALPPQSLLLTFQQQERLNIWESIQLRVKLVHSVHQSLWQRSPLPVTHAHLDELGKV